MMFSIAFPSPAGHYAQENEHDDDNDSNQPEIAMDPLNILICFASGFNTYNFEFFGWTCVGVVFRFMRTIVTRSSSGRSMMMSHDSTSVGGGMFIPTIMAVSAVFWMTMFSASVVLVMVTMAVVLVVTRRGIMHHGVWYWSLAAFAFALAFLIVINFFSRRALRISRQNNALFHNTTNIARLVQ